jgi:hypothetical protein
MKGTGIMADPTDTQQRYRQFLDLLPLTIALAGLPPSDHGKAFNEDQMESRAMTVKKAFQKARQLAKSCCEA